MKILLGLVFVVSYLSFAGKTFAVCPVCTVAVGAGLGLCRILGIDDTISGVWIGGLIISSGLWLADFLKKKNIKLNYLNLWTIGLFFLLVIPPLFWSKMIGLPNNILWGFDKLLLGIITGSVFFILAVLTDWFLRKINRGRVYIYYQKVIIPVFFLTVISFIFYLITC